MACRHTYQGNKKLNTVSAMSRKFVILSNGLRDQCGHYYETSISLAEAARRCGWRPVLAAHVDCPASLLPDWLESYPIFCTDHWMSGPPAEPPDLAGIRTDPYSGERATAAATIRDFLASRFTGWRSPLAPQAEPASPAQELRNTGEEPNARRAGSAHGVSGLRRAFDRYRAAFERAVRLIDRLAFYFLPPVLYATLKKAVAWSVPPILLPELQSKIAAKLAAKFRGAPGAAQPSVIDFGPCGVETAKALENPVAKKGTDTFCAQHPPGRFGKRCLSPFLDDRDYVAQALVKLRACNMAHEVEYAMIFKRDLERFLAVAEIGAGDHVFLGTAHPRELLAVWLICRRLTADRLPTFHFEFRHPLFPPGETGNLDSSSYTRLHRIFFSIVGWLPNIRFYTDTEELSRDFGHLSQQPFDVLPIPFRGELIAPPLPPPAPHAPQKGTGPFCAQHPSGRSGKMDLSPFVASGPLRLAFVGQARDEKGFPWLPDLIDDLRPDYVSTGKVRFVVQANLGDPRYNPLSRTALGRLKRFPPDTVELFGLDGPLSPEEYYRLVSSSHIVLVPYDRERYRACSSGTLSEAIAGGRPVVVPRGTWMAAQLPNAAGEAFDDYASFVSAVRRVVDGYAAYAARAEECRAAWLAKHSPDALIRAVVVSGAEARLAA